MKTNPEISFSTLACIDPATGALNVSETALAALSADIVALTNMLKHARQYIHVVTERRDHFVVTREALRNALFSQSSIQSFRQQLAEIRKSQIIDASLSIAYSNYSALQTHGFFTPVGAWKGPHAGERPGEFPQNMEQLFAWTEGQVTALLDFYDIHLPASASVATRKTALLRTAIFRV